MGSAARAEVLWPLHLTGLGKVSDPSFPHGTRKNYKKEKKEKKKKEHETGTLNRVCSVNSRTAHDRFTAAAF